MSPLKQRRFLWITDPWDTLDHKSDTTIRLMEESIKEGIDTYWCDLTQIFLNISGPHLSAQQAHSSTRLSGPQIYSPDFFDFIFYRTDPPVDLHYQHPLQLLCHGLTDKMKSRIINPPHILLNKNEKIEGSALADLSPRFISSSKWEVLEAFGRQEGTAVLKPLHQAQSKGVSLLEWKTKSQRELSYTEIKNLTQDFTHPVMLQQFLPGIAKGETRLWFLDGKLLTTARKVPASGTFKVDMDRGGSLLPWKLTSNEKNAALRIGKHLRKLHIRMAAVDLIDGLITDFNFTSPGLIVEIEKLYAKNLAKVIIQNF